MGIEVAMLSVLIALILAIISLGYWAGKMSERVGNNRYDIEQQKVDFKTYQNYNRDEHKSILSKLDTIITNGKKSG